ncbi:MAG: ABC transporter ATP-binding protein [Opitutales bacterium]
MVAAEKSPKPPLVPLLDKSPIIRVAKYLFRYPGLFFGTLGFAIAMTLLAVFAPQAIRFVINTVIESQSIEVIPAGILVVLAIYAGQEIFNSLRIRVNNTLEQAVLIDLRAELHTKLLDLPISFFDRRQSGNVASTVIDDVNNVERALLDGTEQGVSALLMITGIGVLIFTQQPVLAGLVFLPVPILFVMGLIHARKSRKIWRQVRDAAGDLNSLLVEDIQGNRLIQSFSLKDREKGRFRDKALTLRERTLEGMFRWARFGPSVSLVSNLGYLGVVGYGSYLLVTQPATFKIGDFTAFFIYCGMIVQPIRQLTQLTQLISTGNASGDRVFDLLDHPVEIEEPADPQPFPPGLVNVTFEGVSFAYAEREEVLPELNLELPAGQVTALVGHTGAGKSTIANLILRYYDTVKGSVRINGTDVRAIGLSQLRGNIGVVAQDPFLFDASVRDNLLLAAPEADDPSIEAALRGACAWEFVRKLPEGLDTLIGERGIRLSQGEKQRLTIARVMLKNPPLVILDEATSSVDTITERQIQAALDNLIAERTVLVIAHRLSTVRRADQIVVLEKGRILERGDHDALIAAGGHYADLWQHQQDLIPEGAGDPSGTING